MTIKKEEALTILEMIGAVGSNEGNTVKEEKLDTRIRDSFKDDPDIVGYDYSEQKQRYGW